MSIITIIRNTALAPLKRLDKTLADNKFSETIGHILGMRPVDALRSIIHGWTHIPHKLQTALLNSPWTAASATKPH